MAINKTIVITSCFFFCLLALDVIGMYLPNAQNIHLIAKPLLMPILITQLWLAKNKSKEQAWKFILVGLVASWVGDVLLMLQQQEMFFIGGLIFFLTTHALYIYYFLKYRSASDDRNNWFAEHRLISLAVVCYSVLFLGLLMPHLGKMMIPVAVYTLVISVMLLQSLASKKRINPAAYIWFIAGTSLFVLSDSLLALNKFVKAFYLSGLLIMVTYGLAQWLIVQGTIRNDDPKPLPQV